jgi:hypothetical protein
MTNNYKETAMKRVIKAASLVLALVLAACLNPADPAEPDLDLYQEVNFLGKNPGSALGILDINDFFTVPGTALNLTPGAGYRNYIDLNRAGAQLNRFKDNDQAIQAVKDSFEFKTLNPIQTGNVAYTSYPEGDIIPIKSVEVIETGATIRIFLDISPTVSQVIQLRIIADKLVGARGEKLDTNGNLITGEPEDDWYINHTVNGPSVTPINSLGIGAGRPRDHQALTLTGAFPLVAAAPAPDLSFTPRPDDKYDVKATLTWNLAKSRNGQEEDSYIKTTLDTHFFVEKYDSEESAWTAVSGAWAVNPSNGLATFTAAATAEDFEIFRLNLKGRKDIVTQGTYYGFTQKLPFVYAGVGGDHYGADEQQVIAPEIPNTDFIGTTLGTVPTVNWINDKGGWLDLALPPAVLGVDPATLAKENFRLYAASANTVAGVLSPVRGIPVDSVSQYLDGATVHLIIKLDPNYKRLGGAGFAEHYQQNAANQATNLQVWIGNVKVYNAAGDVLYLGDGTNVMELNGTEDFFGPYSNITTNGNF